MELIMILISHIALIILMINIVVIYLKILLIFVDYNLGAVVDVGTRLGSGCL